MLKTYQGGCHCGDVRFQCDVDLAAETSRCNCSICLKSRFWKAVIPVDAFKLLAGADAVTEYRFAGGAGGSIPHTFCSRCGVKVFGRVTLPGQGDFIAVSVPCLDASDTELANARVVYQDGRHDAWESVPAETRHL